MLTGACKETLFDRAVRLLSSVSSFAGLDAQAIPRLTYGQLT